MGPELVNVRVGEVGVNLYLLKTEQTIIIYNDKIT